MEETVQDTSTAPLEDVLFSSDETTGTGYEDGGSESEVGECHLAKCTQTSQSDMMKKRSKRVIRNTRLPRDKAKIKYGLQKKSLPLFIRSKFAPMTVKSMGYSPHGCQYGSTKEFYDLKADESLDNLTSCIYATSQSGPNYRLVFTAENVNLEPLFVQPRNPPPNKNEKISQITSKIKLYEDPAKLNYVGIKRLRFSLIESTLSEKPAPPIQVYTVGQPNPSKAPRNISGPRKSRTTGLIYVKIDDFIIKVRTQPLPITKIRSPVTSNVRSTMERLGMPCSEVFKNKAQLLVRLGNDILRLRFDLVNCEVSKLPEHKSLAVQTDNHMIIRQSFSHFTNKRVNLHLPESTYIYQDPMIEIRRVNHYFATQKITPLWKYELYRKRLAQLREHNMVEGEIGKVVRRSRGSTITFDGFDTVVTAASGMMHGIVVKGQEAYDKKMQAHRGEAKKEVEESLSDWRYEEEVKKEVDEKLGEFRSHLWENEEAEETLESLNMPSTFVS